MTPADAVRRQVREALGPYNDPRADVVALVAQLRMDLLMARDEIDQLKLDLAFERHEVAP
jgi:hypothetical protein